MGIAGESSPASGAEHIITHLIDMSADSRGQNVAFHGAQVAVSSLFVSIIWEIIVEDFNPALINIENCFPSKDIMKSMVYSAFSNIDHNGKLSSECWDDYEKKLMNWYKNKINFKNFLLNWDTFKEEIKNMLLSSEFLVKCMNEAGAPKKYCQMNPPVDIHTALWSITNCHLFRNRFTVVDFLFFICWWNSAFIERVLEKSRLLDICF